MIHAKKLNNLLQHCWLKNIATTQLSTINSIVESSVVFAAVRTTLFNIDKPTIVVQACWNR
jgi:hypothetical protein